MNKSLPQTSIHHTILRWSALLIGVVVLALLVTTPGYALPLNENTADLVQAPSVPCKTSHPGGDLPGNETWTAAGSPHCLDSTLTIPPERTLTLQAGVEVQIPPASDLIVFNGGTLRSLGTSGSRVVFTSKDGSADFRHLVFNTGSTVELTFCDIKNGGNGTSEAVRVASSSVTISDCTITDNNATTPDFNGNTGAVMLGEVTPSISPTIQRTIISDNTGAAINQETVNMSPIYTGLTFSGNTTNAVVLVGKDINQAVTLDSADLNGSPFVLKFDAQISAAGSLTLAAGTVVSMTENTDLRVFSGGTFNVQGEAGNPVKIVNATTATTFGGFIFANGSNVAIKQCDISGGGRTPDDLILIQSSDVTIDTCVIHDNIPPNQVIRIDGGLLTPTLHNLTLRDNPTTSRAIFQTTINMNPDYLNITLTNNKIDALVIDGGTVETNVVIDGPAFKGAPVYVLSNFWVGGQLTLTPGTLLEMGADRTVTVNNGGTLQAVGSVTDPITITARGSGTYFRNMFFSGTSNVNLGFCDISRLGGGDEALSVFSSVVTIDNCTIHHTNSSKYVVAIHDDRNKAKISHTTITNNYGAAIYQTTINMAPQYSDIILSGNGTNALVTEGGNILDQDVTLNSPAFHGQPIVHTGQNITIASGRTLTMTAGTELQMAQSRDLIVNTNGALYAVGRETSPVTITTGATSFGMIEFNANSKGTFQYCDISKGGGVEYAIQIQSSNVTIDECSIHDITAKRTIYINGDFLSPAISNTEIKDGTGFAIFQSTISMNPSYSGLTFSGNADDAVGINGTALFPNGGIGATVITVTLDTADINGSPFIFTQRVNINSGGNLVVKPGTEVLFYALSGSSLTVNNGGRLIAEGNSGERISFTSYDPAAYFAGLIFGPGSTARLDYCDVSRAGNDMEQAIDIDSSSVMIGNGRIFDNSPSTIVKKGAIYLRSEGLSPSITDTQIYNNTGYPIFQVSANMTPVYKNLTLTGNTTDAIYMGQGSLNRDVTLDGPELNGAYFIVENVIVNNPYIFTLVPGTEMRIMPDKSITVQGGTFNAVGTPSDFVVVKAVADEPQAITQFWGVIVVQNGATLNMSYCDVSYGGQNNQAAINVNSDKATIINCYLHHHTVAAIRLALSGLNITMRNLAITDNLNNGIRVETGVIANLPHITLARNAGSGVLAAGTATLTNAIIANNEKGVSTEAGGSATVASVLWDTNTVKKEGAVTVVGEIDGSASFAGDGYHITRYSDALNQGTSTAVVDDIDAHQRPLPAGSRADLGADEYIFASDADFATEKGAFDPKWVVRDAGAGNASGLLWQEYLLRFYHNAPAFADPLSFVITDTLPAGMGLETETNTFSAVFTETPAYLHWSAQMAKGETDMILVAGSGVYDPGLTLSNRAEIDTGTYYQPLLASTDVPLFTPLIYSPLNGGRCSGNFDIMGAAQPGVTVTVKVNNVVIGTDIVDASGLFSVPHVYSSAASITAQACTANGCSAASTAISCSSSGSLTPLKPLSGKVFNVTQGIASPVEGVTVTLMVSMTGWGGWVPWPGVLYDQVNPQVTGADGTYTFNVVSGLSYYLQVADIAGHQPYQGTSFSVTAAKTVNVPYTPLQGTQITSLAPGGSATIRVGQAVEWVVPIDGLATLAEFMVKIENPTTRLLSAVDPQTNTNGWDSGLLLPGDTYRRRFTTPGMYNYTDGNNHTGTVTVEPIPAPTPISPLTGAAIQPSAGISTSVQVNFSWLAPPDTSGGTYDVEIDGFPYSTSQTSYSKVLELGQHTWMVRINVDGILSDYSMPQTFNVVSGPGVPAPVAPVDDLVTTETGIGFSWTASSDGGAASKYELLINGTIYTSTTTTRSVTLPVGAYTWQVRAVNAYGTSSYSAARSFEIILAPGTPVHVAPPNELITKTLTLTFDWEAGAGGVPDFYQLEIDGTTAYSPTQSNQVVSLAVGEHSWRVRASKQGYYSAWSTAWSLEIIAAWPAPGVPTLVSPEAGQVFDDADVVFTWTAPTSGGPLTHYELVVDGTVITVTDTTYTLVGMAQGAHSWTVRACNEDGCSANATQRSFEVRTDYFIFLPMLQR